MLHKETVSPFLFETLKELMNNPSLNDYVLVGGTALSLVLGHRKSFDIDLFRPDYRTGEMIKSDIKSFFPNSEIRTLSHGATVYLPDPSSGKELKIDVMSDEPFIFPFTLQEGIRIAHVADIAAMKLEAITSRLEKKDFWDISEILSSYSLKQLTQFHRKRYPWNDLRGVMERITQYEKCEENSGQKNSPEVVCLNGKTWEDVKKTISEAFKYNLLEEKKQHKLKDKGISM